MRCRQLIELLIERESGVAEPSRSSMLDRHLVTCETCRAEALVHERVHDALGALGSAPAPEVDVTRRVMLELRQMGPVAREEVPATLLVRSAAAALVAAVLLGWSVSPLIGGLDELAAGAWPLLEATRHLATTLLGVGAVLADIPLRLALGLVDALEPMLSLARRLQPLAVGAVTLGYSIMTATVLYVVGRDLRGHGGAGRETSR